MRQTQHTLRASEVQQLVELWLLPVLGPWPSARRCTATAVCAVLAYAAQRIASVSDACARLAGAPKGGTVLGLLGYLLSDIGALECRLQVALARHLPRALRRGAWVVALDITLIPYHGQPFADPAEIYRGQRKSGTTHFHAYATAYLVRGGRRFTLALAAVRYGSTPDEIVGALLGRVRAAGVRIRLVLLDRGFNTAGVIRYLQAGRTPFIMPQAVHGKVAQVVQVQTARQSPGRRATPRPAGDPGDPPDWLGHLLVGAARPGPAPRHGGPVRLPPAPPRPPGPRLLPVRLWPGAGDAGLGQDALPPALRHRDQLPADEPRPHPHHHPPPGPAAVVRRRGAAVAEPVGVAALDGPGPSPAGRAAGAAGAADLRDHEGESSSA